MSRVFSCPGVKKQSPDCPASPSGLAFFLPSARSLSESGGLAALLWTWLAAAVRGCGCRLRAVRLVTPGRCPGHRALARARASRWAGRGRATLVGVRVVHSGARESGLTRAKPSWPSPACEPPVQSEPAPAGLACFGNPDPVGMKVYCPVGKETFDDDETTEEAPS